MKRLIGLLVVVALMLALGWWSGPGQIVAMPEVKLEPASVPPIERTLAPVQGLSIRSTP